MQKGITDAAELMLANMEQVSSPARWILFSKTGAPMIGEQ